ncbi:MAG TPA: universal stress protein, partial [Vicinamibacterales bacterium]
MDLIVMGTHGRSGVAHLLMGSVAEKVVRTARCPVMTVRRAPEVGSGQWTVDRPTSASTKASTGRRGGPSGPPSSCPLPTAGYGFTSPNFSMR